MSASVRSPYPRPVRAVIFDLDGTLTESGLDFPAMKREAGCPPDRPFLEFMNGVDAATRRRAEEILERHERAEAMSCALKPDALAVLDTLRRHGVKTAILTRNSRRSSLTVIERFGLPIDAVVAREDAPPKPSGEAVLAVCRALGVAAAETMVVGDYLFDIQAGAGAGALTALLRNARMEGVVSGADFELDRLSDLLAILGL